VKKLVVLVFLVVGALLALSFVKSDNPNPIVVELFTSQGCSSCPSADKLLSELSKNENVLALSFHVSYWNSLGWKDPYSSGQFTERQRAYARKLHLSSIYTPQMIVNGSSEFVGSNRSRAQSEINKATSSQEVNLKVVSQGQSLVTINYALSGVIENTLINIALVERHVKNEVPRGENRGRTLEHDNVVRVFKTEEAKRKGSVSITLPKNLNMKNAIVIAYTQKQHTFKITGAAKLTL